MSPITPRPQRLPRITRLRALAIQIQGQIGRREIRDYAEVACVGYVTRARVMQIMNLLNLAPDDQNSNLCVDSQFTLNRRSTLWRNLVLPISRESLLRSFGSQRVVKSVGGRKPGA